MHSLKCRDEDAPLPHDDDLQEATCELIVGFYDEAFRRLRLPCKAVPDLFILLGSDEICLQFRPTLLLPSFAGPSCAHCELLFLPLAF